MGRSYRNVGKVPRKFEISGRYKAEAQDLDSRWARYALIEVQSVAKRKGEERALQKSAAKGKRCTGRVEVNADASPANSWNARYTM